LYHDQAILLLNETGKIKVENSTQTPIRLSCYMQRSPVTLNCFIGMGSGTFQSIRASDIEVFTEIFALFMATDKNSFFLPNYWIFIVTTL
jgi:hypothetical protein